MVSVVDGEEFLYSQDYACPEHGVSIEELAPRMFSFNNPFGACKTCDGLGVFMKIDPELVVPNPNLSLLDGAVQGSGWHSVDKGSIARMYYEGLADAYGFDLNTPFRELPKAAKEAVLFGTGGKKIPFRRSFMGSESTFEAPFEGVIGNLERRYQDSGSDAAKAEIETLMCAMPCPDCHGARLNEKSLAVTVGGINIDEFCRKSIGDALEFVRGLKLTEREHMIAKLVLREITERLGFLQSVGLELSDPHPVVRNPLGRGKPAHPAGHPDRVLPDGGALHSRRTQHWPAPAGQRQAACHPSSACGILAIRWWWSSTTRTPCLPPTTLWTSVRGAGIHGGHVICAGTVDDIMACEDSLTGQYLSGKTPD